MFFMINMMEFASHCTITQLKRDFVISASSYFPHQAGLGHPQCSTPTTPGHHNNNNYYNNNNNTVPDPEEAEGQV